MSDDIGRRAVLEVKDRMERSRSWRKIMSTGGRHYFEHRQNHHKVVVEITDTTASVRSIAEGNRQPT
mgnify:CR=1 FL=1